VRRSFWNFVWNQTVSCTRRRWCRFAGNGLPHYTVRIESDSAWTQDGHPAAEITNGEKGIAIPAMGSANVPGGSSSLSWIELASSPAESSIPAPTRTRRLVRRLHDVRFRLPADGRRQYPRASATLSSRQNWCKMRSPRHSAGPETRLWYQFRSPVAAWRETGLNHACLSVRIRRAGNRTAPPSNFPECRGGSGPPSLRRGRASLCSEDR